MDDMELFFADKNEIIIDALIHKLKAKIDQFEELVDHYNEERSFRIELEGQVADLKKAAKATKVVKKTGRPSVSKIAPKDMDAKTAKIVKATGGKAYTAPAPVKRGPGRPKKVVK